MGEAASPPLRWGGLQRVRACVAAEALTQPLSVWLDRQGPRGPLPATARRTEVLLSSGLFLSQKPQALLLLSNWEPILPAQFFLHFLP